jgi:hypothetical protein
MGYSTHLSEQKSLSQYIYPEIDIGWVMGEFCIWLHTGVGNLGFQIFRVNT